MAAAAAMEREEEAMEMGAVVRIVGVMEMEAEVCSAKSRTDFCGQAGALGAGLDLRPRCCRGTCVAWRSPAEARPARRRTESRTRPAEANEARTAGDTRAAATGASSEWKV